MTKVVLPDTYAYTNFINEDERLSILRWANGVYSKNLLAVNGGGRFYNSLNTFKDLPSLILEIKKKIIKKEGLEKYKLDTFFEDFLSFNFAGASIHLHTDSNFVGCVHTRYNLIINKPISGGDALYNGNLIPIEEKMLWKCEAGKYSHGSTPVVGDRPRVNISFGFQIDK
jgi:hypothetical protein